MKGEIGLLLVAIVTSLILGGMMFNVFSISSNELSITAKEKELLTSIDQLEMIKQGIPYMMNYSFYQAAYEVGKKGGYLDANEDLTGRSLDDAPCWRIYDSKYFPRKYLDYLAEKMKASINEYPSKLEILPIYSYVSVSLFYSGNELRKAELIANASQLLTYKGAYFVLHDKPNITQNLDLSFFKLFKLGKENFLDKDPVRSAISEAIVKIPQKCKSSKVGDVCEQNINPDGWLKSECPNVEKNLKENIENNLKNLDSTTSFADLMIKVNKTVVKHTSSYTYESEEENYDSCGCKSWGDWVNTAEKGSSDEACLSYCQEHGYQDGKLNETGYCECRNCDVPYTLYHGVEYHYRYKGAAKIKVNISTKKEFPIKEKKLILEFCVISSNDYDYHPL